jgi:Zn-dependent metalloprotease
VNVAKVDAIILGQVENRPIIVGHLKEKTMFGKSGVILAVLAAILVCQFTAAGQSAGNAKAEARKAAAEALVNSMQGGGTSAEVRVFKGSSEYVRSIGAPPSSYFPVAAGKGILPADKAEAFLRQYQPVFMDDSAAVDFSAMRTKASASHSYVRLQQVYSGIPVFGAELTVQLDAADRVVFAFADIKSNTEDLDNGSVALSPTLSAAEGESLALDLAQQPLASPATLVGGELFEPGWLDPTLQLEASPATLMIYAPEVVGSGGPTRLVWQTVVSAVDDPAISELVLVDAHSGDIAFHYSLVYAALNRLVYDSNNTTSDPGALVRSEGGGPVALADANKAYDYFGDTYDFYYAHHGRDSLDNLGMTLSGTVRYCYPGYACPYANAFWSSSAQRMYFGQDYASADDVVGHELTHGVTSNESNLIYFNQSGAINESLSDMWGEWIDLTNGAGNDSPSVRWLMGEDLPIGAIRDMANPPAFGDPDRMGSTDYSADIWDEGGVHYNSGVGNKLCYLLTDGGTFNGSTVTGMGIDRTSDLFYECASNLMTSASDYLDLFILLQQAADNLGYSQADKNNLIDACLAVELGVEPNKVAVGQWVGTWSFPMFTFYHDSRTQSIYLANDIGRSGRITALSLYVTTVPGQAMYYWTIRMKTTSLSSYASPSMDATGWTTCYQANETVSSTGQRTFTFSTPFPYDGTSNLMIDFSHNNTSYTTEGMCLAFVPGGNRTIYAYSDSTNGDPLTWSGVSSPTKHLSTAVPCVALTFSPASANVTNVTSAHANGSFTTGEVIDIDVTFSTAVNVTGAPRLELETGATNRKATYLSGSGTAALRFRYTVASGDTSSDLDYTNRGALQFNGGTIKDVSTQTCATLTLPAPGTAGSLGANKAIVIDTTPPKITVTSPTTGTVWERGTVQTIRWTSVGIPGNVRIYYSTSGSTSKTGPWTPVGWGTPYQGYDVPNDGEHEWQVDAPVSGNVTILVRSMSQVIPGLVNWWDSDGISQTFTVSAPSNPAFITVTAPATGANWKQGTVHNITWESNGVPGSVKVYYSTDGGSTWTGINYSAPNTGSYAWMVDAGLVPGAAALTNVKVRVRSKDVVSLTDDSDLFTISPPDPPNPPFITVTAPATGANWKQGTVHSITWNSNGVPGSVKLYYSTDGGSTWTGINYSAPNTGSYAWTVDAGLAPGATALTNAKVRVRSKDLASLTDDSDLFTISPPDPPANPITLTPTPVALGQILTIGWPTEGITGLVKIYYSLDGGASWTGINYSAPNTGSYAWTVNAGPSTNARIRVRSKLAGEFSGDSDIFGITN